MNDAKTRRRPPHGWLALLLAAALALGAGSLALAQSRDHHGGGRGGPPRMMGPRMGGPGMVGPRMAGPRAPWGGRGPVGPSNRYGPPGVGAWPRGGAYGPGGRWYDSPPVYARPAPAPVYARPPPAPAAHAWRRGAYLPPEYQGYVIQDYGRYHLRRPPLGYSWVQVGGELLLISSGNGLIFDAVPAY